MATDGMLPAIIPCLPTRDLYTEPYATSADSLMSSVHFSIGLCPSSPPAILNYSLHQLQLLFDLPPFTLKQNS